MKNKIKYFTVILSLLIVFSCKEKTNYSKIDSNQTASKNEVHKIVINEMSDGGNYAYINVNENGNAYWMAIPNTEVKIGETYYYDGGMLMKDFESEHLNKTFDEIIFADGIRQTELPVKKEIKNPHENSNPVASSVEEVKIEQPKGGTTLETIFSNKESLSGKSITVKGKVVKVNNGILEKNWVHIVDGTQFENKKSLTVTTNELIKVGDTVTFKGKITIDKDFGYGYVYDILLEEGELIK
jgi:hypothetical protein